MKKNEFLIKHTKVLEMIYDTFDSPVGEMKLCSDGRYLTAVVFTGQKHEAKHFGMAAPGSCPVLEDAKSWLSQYFAGEIPDFLPPMKPAGTPFQLRVWKALLQIPYGKTVTYGELAKKLNCRSAQAVGGAVGRNPISIFIPCHRVIGTNKTLTGYAGGIEKKKALLMTEQTGGIL